MLMLFAIAPAYAAGESEISYETVDDSTKQYDKGDILFSIGGSMFGSGVVTLLASRFLGFGLMCTGGVLTTIGVGVKVRNKLKKRNGNR